ncbi:MAG: 1-acyl-sn-glycerol-3-phosphate acyltransferase, partial [Bryobacteraceae bacterium]
LHIHGRKKEMIVTPEGLNVFPEDVEHVLNEQEGVQDSAVVAAAEGGQERVHAVLVLRNGADPNEILRRVNSRLEDHQKIRTASVWPSGELPRTEGTRKLKRREVQEWVASGGAPRGAREPSKDDVETVVAKYAPDREIAPKTTLGELGLSSLERVELLMALEARFQTTIDETAYTEAASIEDLRRLVTQSELPGGEVSTTRSNLSSQPFEFPKWNRAAPARFVRRFCLPSWILPLGRIFIWTERAGLENLNSLNPPVIFAANHQSHFDVPAILMALPPEWRYRVAPAMSKEFFSAHFFPRQHRFRERLTSSLSYYMASLFFNAYPFPQREAGARQTLRYSGELASEGYCVLIFPEGRITDTGGIGAFQPGVGMMASRLGLPVIPIRLEGVEKVLHRTWRWPRPGRVRVTFGPGLRLEGDDYGALAKQVEDAVKAL